MKALVTYYSRTGNTRKVANAIAKALNCEIDEIHDLKKRGGAIGYISAGFDASFGRATKIKVGKDPKKYDLVVIGTPVWAFTMCPAVKIFLNEHKGLKNVAFFATHGGSGANKAFFQMESMTKKPVAVLSVRDRDIDNMKFEGFISKIKAAR